MEFENFNINRRHFLKGATASAVLSSFGLYGFDLIHREKPWRVGLIGCGWYGTSDLFKLIQVADVEVVSICDVDQKFLSEDAELISQRQKSGKKPRTYTDLLKQRIRPRMRSAPPIHSIFLDFSP